MEKKEDYLNKLFSVENKIAIVTGASRGNGKAISEGLLKAGATVILVDILEKELELTEENFKEQNLNAIKFKCDITSKTEIQELYQFVKTKFKKLDILINNAGVTFPHSSLDYPENFWEDTYKVNLKAPFELCKIFGKMMKESNSGVIVNITTLGAELAFPDNPSYGAFKAGLKHLTKTLAFDLGKFGIRVNNVSPGYMRTDMTKKSWDDPILRQKRTDRTILGRWGESSDLVGSIIFLCSDSSSYVTGADLLVDGGWTIKGL